MEVKYKCLHPVAVPRLTGTKIPVFRCGQCANCLKTKANELAVRAIRECRGQSIAWITLTYDNEHCPIFNLIESVDSETGQITESSYINRDSSFFKDASYKYVYSRKCDRPIRRYSPDLQRLTKYNKDVNPYLVLHTRFMTIDMRDVQLLFKRFREHFGAGNALSNKYICVPEYGGAGYRPHYHLMLFSPSAAEIQYLKSEWNFGYVDVDITEEQATARRIAVYVSKYACKGSFDCPYIKQGLCKKPKRATSNGFGIGDLEELKQRLFSLTDITDPFFNDDLPPVFSDRLLRQLQFNRSYKITDEKTGKQYNYPMPKYLIDKVFKKRIRVVQYLADLTDYNDLPLDVHDFQRDVKVNAFFEMSDKDGYKQFKDICKKYNSYVKTKYKTVSSPLQNALKDYLLADTIVNAMRTLRENNRFIEDCGLPINEIAFDDTYEQNQIAAAEQQFVSEIINNSIF